MNLFVVIKFIATMIGLFFALFYSGLTIAVIVQHDIALYTHICAGRDAWGVLSGILSFMFSLAVTIEK